MKKDTLSIVVNLKQELPPNPNNELVVCEFTDEDKKRKYKYITFKEMLKLHENKLKQNERKGKKK